MKKQLANIAITGITVTGVLLAANKLIDMFSTMNDSLSTETGKFFKWEYGNIYYTKTGKGKPLLLIHDLTVCSSAYEWNRVVRKLSRSYTVYTLDLLGCGRSEKPNITYTNSLYVQLVNDFIRKVIGARANVVATGLSFSFVVMACQMYPEYFEKIIGVSPCDIYDLTRKPGKRRNALKYILESPVIGTFLFNMDTSYKHIAGKASRDCYFKKHLISDDMIRSCYKAAKNGHGQGKYLMASIRSRYTNTNIIPAVEKINNSIFLIGGREHPFINDIIDEYKAHNPAIEDAYISNTNQLPQMESPDKFVKLIRIIL